MTAQVARAQTPDDHEVALSEFREARALIEAGDCPSALHHLRESVAREPSVGARFSMADCLAAAEPLEAWRALSIAALLAYTNHDDRLAQAEARIVQLEQQVPKLHLRLAPADLARAGLEVRVDGAPIDRFQLRRGIVAVEPGKHLVEASAPGRGTFSAGAAARAPGEAVEVSIELPERPPPATVPIFPVVLAPVNDARPREDGRATRRTVGYTLGAVGIVGLGVGAAFGIVALGRANELDDACGGDRSRCSMAPSAVASIRDAGTSAAAVSTIAFIGGGVALATGVALVLFGPPPRAGQPKPTSAAVRVTASGVSVGGLF